MLLPASEDASKWRESIMRWNMHLWTNALEPSDLDGKAPRVYQRADGEIFAPGNYGMRHKGWGEAGHGGVIVSLLASDDGEWLRELARQKDANAIVTPVQLPKTD